MADGQVLIDTEIDTEGVKKGTDEMKNKVNSAVQSLSNLVQTAKKLPASLMNALKIDGIKGAEDAEQDLLRVGNRVRILQNDLKELERQGLTFGDRYYDGTYQELTQAKAELEQYKKRLTETDKSQKKTANSTRKLNSELDKTKKSAKGAHKSMSMMGMLGRSILFSFAFRAISGISNGIKEGMQNLAKYSGESNRTLSSLMSALTRLKNSFATAFSPLLTIVEPMLTRFINMLSTAVAYVGMFISALTGKSTFTQAIAVQQNYASSLNNTAKAAKKAAKQLYAFDELNVVQNQEEDSGSGGGALAPGQMFENVSINPRILELVEKLKNLFAPVIASWERLKQSAQPLLDTIGNGLIWFYDNVLAPFGSWTISEAIPAFFDVLGAGAQFLNSVLIAAQPVFSWLWDNFLEPIAEFTGGIIISILEGITWCFKEMANWINQDAESWILFTGLLQYAGAYLLAPLKYFTEFANMLLKNKQFTDNLKLAFRGLLTFISGVFSLNFKKAFTGLRDFLKGILNGMIEMVEMAVNFMIDKINSIGFDVPDWVPVFGGKSFHPNIPKIKLPRLAAGTVVPRRAGEFAAILGDNNREAEVVSPLSTIKQALREELGDFGGFGGHINIIAEGDVAQLIRFIKFSIEQESKRTGVSLTKVVQA